jgi:chromosome segregation ATPase
VCEQIEDDKAAGLKMAIREARAKVAEWDRELANRYEQLYEIQAKRFNAAHGLAALEQQLADYQTAQRAAKDLGNGTSQGITEAFKAADRVLSQSDGAGDMAAGCGVEIVSR